MTIHPMVSIAQLEPAFNEPDPYGRVNDRDFPPVTAENDIEAPQYEIKRFVNKRLVRNRFQYFVKWKSYGMEHNTWYGIADFEDVEKAIDDYEKFNTHFPGRRAPEKFPQPKKHVLPDAPFPSQFRRLTAKQQTLIETQPVQRGR